MRLPIHRAFQKLANKYGPVISLRLGSFTVIIVQSSSLAEECFTTKDSILASRPTLPMHKEISFDFNIMTSAPYDGNFRTLRRVSKSQIFATSRLILFTDTRRDEIFRLCCKLYDLVSNHTTKPFTKVKLIDMLTDLTFNVTMRMISGKRFYDNDNSKKEAMELSNLMEDYLNNAGSIDLSIFFPVLELVTGGRYKKKLEKIINNTDNYLQSLLDESKSRKDGGRNTMIDHLLSLQVSEPNIYTDMLVKGSIWQILLGGTHTTVATIEWAFANLVNNPDVLKKVRSEIDCKVGQDKLMEESDMPNLHYLQMVILETLRLYPVVPLLVPHLAIEDCTIGSYHVPKDTVVMFNAWTINRDPKSWDEPATFKPERFDQTNKKDVQFKMITFGHGRRGCPGIQMAMYVMSLVLGSLIQCFEWERVSDELVDMDEDLFPTFTMHKGKQLEVKCKPRDIAHKLLRTVW